MKKKYLCFFVYLLLLCSFKNCFSQNENICYNSVSHIEGNNAYLKKEGIKITETGIYIYIQGQLIPISTLQTDAQGPYFDLNHMNLAWDIPPTCPICGYPLVIFWCPNPNCSNYGGEKNKA